jgi:antitoxin component YwqK of YwqJK toxin-antitoxin module
MFKTSQFVLLLAGLTAFINEANAQISPENYFTADEIFEKGAELYHEEEYDKAYDQFMTVHYNDTAYYDARRRAVECAEINDRYDTIIEVCSGVLELEKFNPYKEGFRISLISAMIGKEDSEGALKEAEDALLEFPRSAKLHYQKSRALYRLELYDEAIVSLQTSIRFNPRYYSAHWYLGKICSEAGYHTKAALALNMAIFMNASESSALSAIGFLESIYGGGIDKKIDNLNFPEEEEFDEIDLMIKNRIAENSGYKVKKMKLGFNFIKHNHLIFEKMEYNPGDHSFWNQNYVKFFKEIYTKGDFNNYAYYQCLKIENAQVQATITKNKKKIIAFINWAAPRLTECFNERKVREGDKYVDNNLRHISRYGFDEEGSNVDGKRTGHFKSFDVNGLLTAEGDFNNDGELHGKWTYYKLGAKELEMTFENDKLAGDRTTFYGNGSRNETLPVADGKIVGNARSFYGCNQIYSETPYNSEGVKDGEAVIYFASGQVSHRINYKEGKLNGKFNEFYRSGQVHEELTYVDGKKVGPVKNYHANGKVRIEGQYEDNKPSGHWKYFFDNDQLEEEGDFKNGYRVGIWKSFDRFGTINSETDYGETGKKTGIYKDYDLDGNLVLELEYKGEEVNKYTTYDSEGKVLSQAEKKKRELDFVDYHENGKKRVEGKYYKGEQIGTWKFYNLQEVLVKELVYDEEGLLEGKSHWYFDDGSLEIVKEFSEGYLDGYFVEYYRNGQIFTHGWYKEGQRVGQWDLFYKDGKLANTKYYLDGELHGDHTFYDEKGNLDEISNYFYGVYMSSTSFDTLNNSIYRVDMVDGAANAEFLGQNGKLSTVKEFKGGNSHGPSKGFYWDGTPRFTGAYINGNRDGEWIWYDRNGKMSSKGSYYQGMKIGDWFWYFEDGSVKIKESYIKGNLEGKVKRYYENGKIRFEKNYRNDEMHGTMTYYDELGEVKYFRYYDDGRMIGYSYLGSDGNPVEMIPFERFNGKIEAFYKNGKPSYTSEFSNGYSEGPTVHYHSNGKKKDERIYHKDQLTGVYKAYYTNGKLKEESAFENGDMNGVTIEYYANGNKKSVENYINDDLYGWAEYYSKDGKLIEKAYYYNNVRIK